MVCFLGRYFDRTAFYEELVHIDTLTFVAVDSKTLQRANL
jgi:hypothetical protein